MLAFGCGLVCFKPAGRLSTTHGEIDMTAVAKASASDLIAELEALKHEASKLNETRIRIVAEIERAQGEKDSLERDLLAEYGTSDLEKLREILRSREEANAKAVGDYRESIEKVRGDLLEITKTLAAMGVRV